MRTPLCLVPLFLASFVRAQTPARAPVAEPPSKVVEESRFYRYTNKNDRIAEVAGHKDIYLSADMGAGAMHEVCLVTPASDWVLAGAPPAIEQKYTNLLWRVGYAIASAQGRPYGVDTVGTCEVTAYNPYVYLAEYSNFYFGGFDKTLKDRIGFNSCYMSALTVDGQPKYACHGKTCGVPAAAIVETLNLLLKAKDKDSVRDALGEVRTLYNSELFRDSVEALVKDKTRTESVTIKHRDEPVETLLLRVLAMRTLATIERTERSAKLLALIWHDQSEPEPVREGAIRAFAFVTQYPGPAITSAQNRPGMYKSLYSFIVPLMNLTADEYDKRDASVPKKELSGLGRAAECAANMFPRKLQLKARKGKKFDDPD